MSTTRTIDNLGLEASVRYAKDRASDDVQFFEEARLAHRHAQVDVSVPTSPSEIDRLFDLSKKNRPWSALPPPPQFDSSRRLVFSRQVIPSLGTQERMDVQMQKIEEEKQRCMHETAGKSPEQLSLQREECDKMLQFHESLISIDRDFSEIEGRRNQYSKG